jgi:hypothetical protein
VIWVLGARVFSLGPVCLFYGLGTSAENKARAQRIKRKKTQKDNQQGIVQGLGKGAVISAEIRLKHPKKPVQRIRQ